MSYTKTLNNKNGRSVGETDDAKISRLKREITGLESRRDDLQEQIDQKYNELDALQPPFQVGDIAKNARGAEVRIEEIDQAFGSWVVQVSFLKAAKGVEHDRVYTYMAEDLELVERA